MPSIASVYVWPRVEVLPETAKIADGLKRALLEADKDVREAARRWKRIIDRELSGETVEVDVDADTTKARKEIDKAAKGQKSTIEVDADAAKAEAEIDHAARDRKAEIKVDIDRDGLGRVVSTLGPQPRRFRGGRRHQFRLQLRVGLIPGAVAGATAAFGTLALATWRGRRIQCGSVRRRRGVRRVTRDPDTRRPAGRARDPKHLHHSYFAAAADGVCELHRLTVEMH
jgi:hypothetical protein